MSGGAVTDALTTPFGVTIVATLHATVLVLALLLVHRLAGARLSSRFAYALWLLVALRRCVPIGVASPLSAFNLMPGFAALTAARIPVDGAPSSSDVVTVTSGAWDRTVANDGLRAPSDVRC